MSTAMRRRRISSSSQAEYRIPDAIDHELGATGAALPRRRHERVGAGAHRRPAVAARAAMADGGVSGRGHRLAGARALAGGERADHALPRRRDQRRCRHESQRSATTRRAMPLEALVERQPLRTGSDRRASLRLAVESGLHFLRMLDAQATSRSYRADFIERFALQPPTDAERAAADRETLAYWKLMAGRAPDARRLFAAFRAADGRRLPLPADLGVAAGDRAEVDRAIDEWLAQQTRSLRAARQRAGRVESGAARIRVFHRRRVRPGRDRSHRRAIQRRPSRLAQRRHRSGDQPRREAGQRCRVPRARDDSGACQFSWRARAALLGDGGREHRLRPAAGGSRRSAAPHAERVRDELRQRLVRDPDRSADRHVDAHTLAGRGRQLRRADADRADERSGETGHGIVDVRVEPSAARCERAAAAPAESPVPLAEPARNTWRAGRWRKCSSCATRWRTSHGRSSTRCRGRSSSASIARGRSSVPRTSAMRLRARAALSPRDGRAGELDAAPAAARAGRLAAARAGCDARAGWLERDSPRAGRAARMPRPASRSTTKRFHARVCG